jgi:enoyl-CoA hydratase/carnithine racemase
MPYTQIRYAVADGVATITLHRPEKLNAFTIRMQQELCAAIDEVDADPSVRAVVLTGEGRAFCAGADLSPPADDAAKVVEPDGRTRDEGGLTTLRFFACTKPMIGAINGPAVGIGATMTLPLDVRLASSTAKIGFVFAKRGLVPEAASSWFLPRVVGISRAMEWCATGRLFGPDEALAGGLVRSVHEPDDLLPAAYELAREMAEGTSATSVTMTRALLWHMLGAAHPMEAHRADSAITSWCFASPDFREGAVSFLQKRPAEFPNSVPPDLPAAPVFPFWDEPSF